MEAQEAAAAQGTSAPDQGSAPALATIAECTLRWPFRMWSFGEPVALHGLLSAGRRLARVDYRRYVEALCLATIGRGLGRHPDDHLAPGTVLIDLYEITGDDRFLDAAGALVDLHLSLPANPHGALLVRAHQAGWRHQIWADSLDLIGPLFARYAAVSGKGERYAQAVRLTLAHARLLQAESGLFRHGYDSFAGPNGHFWARGCGWALLGMARTLALVPAETPDRAELVQRLDGLLHALEQNQRASGLWTTVLDRGESYEETTLAAMVVHGLGLLVRSGMVEPNRYSSMTARARAAVRARIGPDGALGLVSDATPVGQFSTYATRPFGIFPWGQGPLLLMECEE